MAFAVFPFGKKLVTVLFALITVVTLVACSGSEEKPARASILDEQKTYPIPTEKITRPPSSADLETVSLATIAVGWQWLHGENMKLVNLECGQFICKGTLTYTLVFDANKSNLSEQQLDFFYESLPMCANIEIASGNTCEMEETLLFVPTRDYGWMPEVLVLEYAELTSEIAGWKEKE